MPRIGPLLETHERFPRRTNVQVARRMAAGAIEARVWERGVGETTVVRVERGRRRGGRLRRGRPTIRFPGGDLHVRLDGGRAFLTGPAVRIRNLIRLRRIRFQPRTPIPYSRSASFSDVLRSVDSLRWPMISAHARWYVPAGNSFGRVPGTTTERGGT